MAPTLDTTAADLLLDVADLDSAIAYQDVLGFKLLYKVDAMVGSGLPVARVMSAGANREEEVRRRQRHLFGVSRYRCGLAWNP
jgi:hypothetical protein